jgi:hypothetical protein
MTQGTFAEECRGVSPIEDLQRLPEVDLDSALLVIFMDPKEWVYRRGDGVEPCEEAGPQSNVELLRPP